MITKQLRKIAKKLNGKTDSAGIFIKLPKQIAKFFPFKKEDSSPPHITVLYIGKISKEDKDLYLKVIDIALQKSKFGKVYLKDLKYFKNKDNQWIAHNPIECSGLNEFRNMVWKACEALNLEIQDGYPKYKPHATYAYLDSKNYDKEYFTGSFDLKEIEVWGFDKPIKFKCRQEK